MADRLISADDLIERAYRLRLDDREQIAQMIESAPTVDAVEVVRCKDCKWYEIAQIKREGTDDKRYTPSVCVRNAYANWYCADGERREDDGAL